MDNSPLNSIPAELRNRIYDYALHENGSVAISPNFITEPGLLRTCKQVRTEAELLFYAINHFTAIYWFGKDDSIRHLVCFLERKQGKRLALMRKLTIRIEAPGLDLHDHLTQIKASNARNWLEKYWRKLPAMLSTFDFQTRQLGTLFYFKFNNMSDETSPQVANSSEPGTSTNLWLQQCTCWFPAIEMAFAAEMRKNEEWTLPTNLQRLQNMRKRTEVEA